MCIRDRHDVGYIISDQKPEYVVLGETLSYSFERITQAMRFVDAGARFIATNPDVSGPGEGGMVPATGAVAAMISAATGVQPYYIGKPNPLIMRTALRTIEAHSEDSDVYKRQDTWFSLVGVFCQLRWQKTPTKEKSTALPKANNAFCVSSTYILG